MSCTQQTSSDRFRVAEAGDAEAIMTLINEAFRPAERFFLEAARIDLAGVQAFLEAGTFLLAERNAVITGCVYVEKRGRRSYLGLLSIDPALQGTGLGSVLMKRAEDYCRRLDCEYMDILVVHLREELTRFYSRRGYVETGTSAFPADIETKMPVHFIEMSKRL